MFPLEGVRLGFSSSGLVSLYRFHSLDFLFFYKTSRTKSISPSRTRFEQDFSSMLLSLARVALSRHPLKALRFFEAGLSLARSFESTLPAPRAAAKISFDIIYID